MQELIAEQTDEGAQCVMCLGHNKGWEEAASSFAVRSSVTPSLPVSECCIMNAALPRCSTY